MRRRNSADWETTNVLVHHVRCALILSLEQGVDLDWVCCVNILESDALLRVYLIEENRPGQENFAVPLYPVEPNVQ